MFFSKEAFSYAWHGSGRKWDAVWLQGAGGAIGGFIIWYWGLKVPSEILDNPAFSGVVAIAIGAICGALVAFVLRWLWWPVHSRLIPLLRSRLGIRMGPIVLMAAGFFLFMAISGAGLIWLVVQNAREPTVAHAASKSEVAAVVPSPIAPDPQTQFRMQIFSRTGALSAKDKEELSITLRGMAQTFGEADKLVLGLRTIGQEINGHRAVLASSLTGHNEKLDALRKSASALKVRLQDYFHNQYFDQQTSFIMGNDANKAAIAEAQAEQFQNFLAALLAIRDKDAPFPDLLIPALKQFEEATSQFNSWLTGCESRLAEMKQQVL